jgi:hypothetical protein
MSYIRSIYDPRIIVEIEDMSYIRSIYDSRIMVEIEDMSYVRSIYDPTFQFQFESDESYTEGCTAAIRFRISEKKKGS